MIVKLRKGQKHSKILKTIANFNKTLQKIKIKIFKTISLSQEIIEHPYFKV